MQGKPLLIAAAAFVIVLMGGAAIAGVGGYLDTGPEPLAATHTPVLDDIAVPETTTSTQATAEKAVIEPPSPPEKAQKQPTDDTEKESVTKSEPAEKADSSVETETDSKSDGAEAKEKAGDEAADFVFTLTKPENGAHVKSKVVTFGGEASDGVTVHRGKYSATPINGYWTMDLVVSPGENHVTFEATDADGATVTASVKVHYDAPASEKPKDDSHEKKDDAAGEKHDDAKDEKDEATVPFSAAQKYGSCGEAVPYDVFYGTASPGTTVKVYSDYGSGAATANEKGHWELKVKFPESPVGKTFPVTVKSKATGETKTFQFTNTNSSDGKDH